MGLRGQLKYRRACLQCISRLMLTLLDQDMKEEDYSLIGEDEIRVLGVQVCLIPNIK